MAMAERGMEVKQRQMDQKEELDDKRHKESISAITKPRKLVRGKDGRAEGAE